MKAVAFAIFFKLFLLTDNCGPVVKLPIVINTWGFTNATIAAWDALNLQEATAVSSSSVIMSVIVYFMTIDDDKIFQSLDRSRR